jgi:serine/threonine kinase PknH
MTPCSASGYNARRIRPDDCRNRVSYRSTTTARSTVCSTSDMRMINGSDLRKILKNFGPMTPARAVAIVRQVASALDAAHEGGVMHRDVKPENILINRDDFAYLVDFGIANAASDEKLTELGTAVGTYAYMAPERFTSGVVTYRADVYALACVLHECLTRSQPYGGDSVSAVITAHLRAGRSSSINDHWASVSN